MKDDLETTLSKLAQELRELRATVQMNVSSPYTERRSLVVTVGPSDGIAPARAITERILAESAYQFDLDISSLNEDRPPAQLWSKMQFMEGLELLTDYIGAIAEALPPNAPRDINGFALLVTDYSTDAVFSTCSAIEATQADYARSAALRGDRRDLSFVRVHPAEWYSNRVWSNDYIYTLREHEIWTRWTNRATELAGAHFEDYRALSEICSRWMLGICHEAVRRNLQKLRALPHVTDDFIAFVHQRDMDEETRLLDLAQTVGFERAASLLPLLPTTRYN